MRTQVPSSSGRAGADASVSGASLLDALRRGALVRTLPLAGEVQALADAELRRRLATDPSDQLHDDLTNLAILRRHATLYERRWQELLGSGFDGWPQPPQRNRGDDPFALVSEEELHSQLVGQPLVEALDRRFADVLDVIDSRLWSLAADLGAAARPVNPIGPRALVEAFLGTFPVQECNPPLRQLLMRQFERLAGERLGEVYAWFNKALSDAGVAMTRAGDYALLLASPMGTVGAAADATPRAIWAQDNALDARDSTWREGRRPAAARAEGGPLPDAHRGNALRAWARTQRHSATEGGPLAEGTSLPTRGLRDEEFLAVLSLLQGDVEGLRAITTGTPGLAARLREHLRQGAARLGMERSATHFSDAQEGAIDLAGAVLDGVLDACFAAPASAALLQRLCCPYARLALAEPRLFDADGHPAHAWLDLLVEQWDGNRGEGEADAELLALAEDSVDDVVAEYHGDAAVFTRALQALREALEPRRLRAEIAERRGWQSLQGRERLQEARAAADEALAQCLGGERLLDSVASFLCDQWRQSLVHAWLRDGGDSARYREALGVGESIVATDRAAAHAEGREVAERLIALQQPLRDCFVACGLDESGANGLLALLVADLSRPDAQRRSHVATPLADEDEPCGVPAGPGAGPRLVEGQGVLMLAPVPARLRVAWVSPLSGRCLVVNRQGARHAVWSPGEVAALVASGQVVPRAPEGAVEAVLHRLHGPLGAADATLG